jgi:hypothetical protein
MSKGLQYAIYLIEKNYQKSTDELEEILKPYKNELCYLGGILNVQVSKM